jgi:hypothetical protein
LFSNATLAIFLCLPLPFLFFFPLFGCSCNYVWFGPLNRCLFLALQGTIFSHKPHQWSLFEKHYLSPKVYCTPRLEFIKTGSNFKSKKV